MPKIKPIHWKKLKKVLEDYGCSYKRKKESHHILTHPDAKRTIVIPEYSEWDGFYIIGHGFSQFLSQLQQALQASGLLPKLLFKLTG